MKSDEYSIAKEKLENYLRDKQMRSNPKRFAILEKVCLYEGHFTIEEMFLHLQQSGQKISRATVYNTIDLFHEIGFVVKHQIMDGRMLYEYATKKKHCHCVCVKCGKIKEFTDDVLKTAIQTKRIAKFKQSDFSLCIYGICSDCQKKEK